MKPSFMQAIRERVLILDGAMGTMLQERGLKPGQAPEELNLLLPEVVAGVHREYVAAGADIIVTNSFGGSREKLSHHGLSDRVREINRESVVIARSVAGDGVYVAASIGPTGQFVEPVGAFTFDRMKAEFSEQAEALIEAGSDVITLETFLDIKEIRAAIIAIRELDCRIPVIAMLTFDNNGRTVLGTSPEAAAITLEAAGADIIGSNCGLGVEGICDLLKAMRSVTRLPLISQANAGLPTLKEGKTIFPGTPEEMSACHELLISIGVRIIGGCCGTTPGHIRAMREALTGRDVSLKPVGPPPGITFLSSRGEHTAIGGDNPVAIIGERINPTGKKAFGAELREGKVSYIRQEAMEQATAGATLLDINVGAPGIDEPDMMERAVFCVSGIVSTPLVLDSSDPAALERGLKAADGKVLVNSVSGEKKSLDRVLPLVKKYGAAVIGLALDEKGIPATAGERVAVAARIKAAAGAYGIAAENVLIDCLTLTVSAEQKRAMETLAAVRLVKEELKLNTVLGVSNISFGLPCRPVISSAFFSMAMSAGLDAAIINPKEQAMMDGFRSSMVLLNRDRNAARYIEAYGNRTEVKQKELAASGTDGGVMDHLARAVIDGDRENVIRLVESALEEGFSPLQVGNEGLLPGLEEVGRRFEKQIFYLPQVMTSAETMQIAFARLKEEMRGQSFKPLAKILMATVEGDIHDIGKNIVITLLENHNFEVIDLGKNVPAEKIVSEAISRNVDAVGLSALMTTTMAEMEKVIHRLNEAGVRAFTMVGGAVVTSDYATSIGADLYASDAMDAVAKIKELLRHPS